uniref:ATP synthase F0 subunit 8 n=1 Tax=Panagrolaimus sp. PS1159 TaxID=55785 RepID=A0AC35GLP7_9BILA
MDLITLIVGILIGIFIQRTFHILQDYSSIPLQKCKAKKSLREIASSRKRRSESTSEDKTTSKSKSSKNGSTKAKKLSKSISSGICRNCNKISSLSTPAAATQSSSDEPSMPTNVNLTKFKVSNSLSSLPNSNTLPSNLNNMPASKAKTALAKSER